MNARASDVATHADLAELRAELRADIAELRQEMRVGFAKTHEEMAHLEIRFERRFGDLIKWSFVFWVGGGRGAASVAPSAEEVGPPLDPVRGRCRPAGIGAVLFWGGAWGGGWPVPPRPPPPNNT